jgi:FkbM family methyltransferase
LKNIIGTDYINQRDKELTKLFISSTKIKKYILGINKLAKSVQKHVEVDGIIDDFTRIHTSRKKHILKIDEVDKNSIILSTATGSPLEVGAKLDEMGFTHFNYLSFYKYSSFDLADPPFITDFKDDYKENKDKYKKTFDLLCDDKSKQTFEKVINFKISFDFDFMKGFTNNHEAQYFDKEIIPEIKNIRFVDGGAYIGDTLKEIIKNYPDYKKIYCIEPSDLHINIAKKNFVDEKNIEFINCGLGNKKQLNQLEMQETQVNCDHNYQTNNINTIDNLINEEVDYIKLDIEGAEQDTIEGAAKTIKKYKPILAICIYHKAQDWYKIPQKVLDINPDYNIYLRHYMEGIYETVMYFIPR